MDVMTIRFTIIFLIILVGLFIIPLGVTWYWIRKYGNKDRWWMFPSMIIYIICFFYFAPDLVPEKWTLKPVEVYHCEWKTNYIPKYPIN